MQPTFGVSFGLPQPSHSGYPINPFDGNPIYNPYGPALNSGGLNLGLLSVSPLLSVQVTKNDYGEKVVKPFVNLHVTPNEHVVNKIGHLFHEKKHYLLNKHEHYHHHNPYPYSHGHHYPSPPPAHHYKPSYHHHHGPPHLGPPVYSPHYTHYEPEHFKSHQYSAHEPPAPVSHQYSVHEPPAPNEDYYDDEGGQYDDANDYSNLQEGGYHNYGFERSANNSLRNNRKDGYANRYAYSRSFTLPSNRGANRGGQTIRFPNNRKKREISVDEMNETIEEVINPCKPIFHKSRISIEQPDYLLIKLNL